MNRLRRLYFELAPGLAGHLAPPSDTDEVADVLRAGGMRPSRIQMLLTVAGMVSVMNSIVLGVLVGALGQRLAPDLIWLSVSVGALTFAGAVAVHQRVQMTRRKGAPDPLSARTDG